MKPTRLRQVDGGWLLTADFRDAPRLPARRLAQHHRAAHHSWGVAGGLDVWLRESQVLVEPGVALNRCGDLAVLSRPVWLPLGEHPSEVVLAVVGHGPRAEVWLRPERRDLDIPLASIDGQGELRSGDTHRQWLRRPGPTLNRAGTVAVGTPVTGIWEERGRSTGWKVHVDLTPHHLAAVPTVIGGLAGAPVTTARHLGPDGQPQELPVQGTTVEVVAVTQLGFDLVVRSMVTGLTSDSPAPETVPQPIRTSSVALSWLAVLPAARPDFPAIKERS